MVKRLTEDPDPARATADFHGLRIAREHGIPFFVVALCSTFDLSLPDGSHIPIEERPASEVTEPQGQRIAPEDCQVYSPAFDITPARLVSAIITEKGIIHSPTSTAIQAAFEED